MNNPTSISPILPTGRRVCLVTEELAGIGSSGGIGAAFLELGQLLAVHEFVVDVLYCPIADSVAEDDRPGLMGEFAERGIKLAFLDTDAWVHAPLSCEKRAYAVARHLMALEQPYDVVHFHDYKGLGSFATSLKRQGLAFATTTLVVQLHGPTRWTIEANQGFFTHEDQLKIDHLERMSISQADIAISPSAYLLDWLREHDFVLPQNTRVIKNVCSDLAGVTRRMRTRLAARASGSPATDLVFFARHEDRKGFGAFCDALDLLKDELVERQVTVTFVGKFGMVDGQPSGLVLVDRAKHWRFPIRLRTGLARNEAVQYILSRNAPVVVIPSPAENSPYTVLETIMLGVPVISSNDGGGPELFADRAYRGLCRIDATELAQAISDALKGGLEAPIPAETGEQIDRQWLAFHHRAAAPAPAPVAPSTLPRVTFAITHHERPKKLVDAILSAVCQTYPNVEILVVDDGSATPATVAALAQVRGLLERVGGRLVCQPNAYLGAARNTAVREASGEYICFLDDDDLALPDMVRTLVTAIESSGDDAVSCLNLFMDESLRGEALARTSRAPCKVNYVPMGGPLALAPIENCLGAATAIFRKSALIEVGGYSELKGVGHEDYELYLRLLQAGKRVAVVPLPLYFYEVGRPSMLSRTSMSRNFRRCFDAVDSGLNIAAWRDTLSLSVGKSVAINLHNRHWWLQSLTPTAEQRHRVVRGGMERGELLQLLIGLAAAEGSARIQAAFAEDLALGDDAGAHAPAARQAFDVLDAAFDGHASCADSPVVCDPDILELRLNLSLGRFEDAVRQFASHLSQVRAVDDDVVQIVHQLLNDPAAASVPIDAWHRLCSALRACRVPRASVPVVARMVLSVSLMARDVESAKLLLKSGIRSAEAEYLRAYPDVDAGVKAGIFASGLDHFERLGKEERRSGFALLDELYDIIGGDPDRNRLADEIVLSLRAAA